MRRAFLCALFVTGISAAVVLGQTQKGANQDKNGTVKPGGAVAANQMALQLAEYGREHKSALALLTAAQILLDAPSRPGPANVKPAEEAPSVAPTSKAPARQPAGKVPSIDPASLVKEAQALAGNDQALQGMFTRIQSRLAEKQRGDVTGPNRRIDRVRAGYNNTYTITFEGGKLAEVLISGDGDTDLDLYVYDANNNLITSSTSNGDDEYVAFLPYRTSPFRIVVKNLGTVYNDYLFITN